MSHPFEDRHIDLNSVNFVGIGPNIYLLYATVISMLNKQDSRSAILKATLFCSPIVPLNLLKGSCPSPATGWKSTRLHGLMYWWSLWVTKFSLSLHKHNSNYKPSVSIYYINTTVTKNCQSLLITKVSIKPESILNISHPWRSGGVILKLSLSLPIWDLYSLFLGHCPFWIRIQSGKRGRVKGNGCILLRHDSCLTVTLF